MSDKLKIALFQSDLIWENIHENINQFDEKINEISSDIDLVILPEMFSTGFSMNPTILFETMNGDSVSWMKNTALKNQVAITGSLIIKEGDNYYNRLFFVYPNGTIETYDKRHLFTYGGEDKVYSSGNERLILDYKGWKFCPLICYDLRFPVWSRNDVDYDVLIYVANWPKPRTFAWDTLLKARSIENMCYTVGVNRVGVDGNNLEYIGHSQVVDMLGNELIDSDNEKEDIYIVTLEKRKLIENRNRFRFLNDKDSFSIEQ